MARFEALITPVADGQALRAALEQIAQSWGAALTWLDRRNASMDLVAGGLPVKLLLELRRGDVLGVLVSSQEGMGSAWTLATLSSMVWSLSVRVLTFKLV
nr:hypothetical protein [Cyanobium sp. BA20m-14]